MTVTNLNLSAELNAYIESISPAEPAVLTTIRENTLQLKNGHIMLSVVQIRLMCWLAKLIKARRYLELGVFTGYSSTAMALQMGPDSHSVVCEINQENAAVARQHWQQAAVEQRISLYLQPALTTLVQLGQENTQPFDIALIDADKNNLPAYIEHCYHLLRRGGILVVDNILRGGKVLHQQSGFNSENSIAITQKMNLMLRNDRRFNTLPLPLGDGMTLLIKN